MKKYTYISVSTDPISNFQEVVEYAKDLQGKADFLHCDVMDGKFVKQTTYDAEVVKNINDNSTIMLDVHLMMDNPQEFVEDYINAGANILTVHYEAFSNKEELVKTIKDIKFRNALVGIAIKPETQFKDVRTCLYDVDVVLVMSVEPGLSGQKFMPMALDKIKQLDKFRQENNLNFKIEVDGGINLTNKDKLIECGADILVSGSFVHSASNKLMAINSLR